MKQNNSFFISINSYCCSQEAEKFEGKEITDNDPGNERSSVEEKEKIFPFFLEILPLEGILQAFQNNNFLLS